MSTATGAVQLTDTQARPSDSTRMSKCSISGLVTHLLTGSPVKKAALQLTIASSESNTFTASTMSAMGVPPSTGAPSYSAVSETDGSFCFENVAPGKYILSGNKDGFLPTKYGARSSGESGKTVVIGTKSNHTLSMALIPHAVISGRVFDADDEPVSGVFVNVLAQTWINGRPRSVAIRGSQTNDLGEYRVSGLAPGTYYVRVDPKVEDPASGSAREGFQQTFYPSVRGASEATPIMITAGNEGTSANIRMLSGKKHHVRGRVTGLRPSDRGGLTLLPEGEEPLFLGVGGGNIKPDGTFDFSGVAAGTYVLKYVQISGDAAKGGRRMVEVGDRDVDDITIATTMPAVVRGRVQIEGTAPDNKAVSLRSLHVALAASDVLVGPTAVASMQDDGTFAIRDIITPGRYLVRCTPPPGAYVKSIHYGQTNVTTAELDFSDGAVAEMEIVYRYGVATVSGTVSQPGEDRRGGHGVALAHVVLVPKELDPAGRGIQFAGTDVDGSFSIKGVPPGQYRAYAMESVDYPALRQPAVLKALESLGADVEIDEGASKSLSLELVSPDKTRRVIDSARAQ